MLSAIYYFYNKIINFFKEKFYYSNQNNDYLVPTRKEQEFINFNLYSKSIIIDNDNDNDNENDNENDNDNLIQK